MLEIKNLHVNVDGREILKGLDLTLPAGEVHAIMGPNGSGKSTLAYVLAGKEDYEVTEGTVTWNGEDLLEMDPSERAAAGVFLAFQYPIEIPGVATMTFLRTAVNAVRKARGEAELSTPDFLRLVREKAQAAQDRPRDAQAPAQCRLLRRREEAQRNPADGAARAVALRARRDRFRPRHRRRAHRGRRRQRAPLARPRSCWSSPTISGCSTTSCRTGCMCCRTGGWRALAAPSLRSSSKHRVTPNSDAAAGRLLGETLWTCRSRNSGPRPSRLILDQFVAAEKALPGARDNWCRKLRRKAIEAYGTLGLPHRRIEAWKYTDLRARIAEVHPLVQADGVADRRGATCRGARRATSRRFPPIVSSSSRAICAPICPTSPG